MPCLNPKEALLSLGFVTAVFYADSLQGGRGRTKALAALRKPQVKRTRIYKKKKYKIKRRAEPLKQAIIFIKLIFINQL